MKEFKRILSLLLTVAVICTMSITGFAFADEMDIAPAPAGADEAAAYSITSSLGMFKPIPESIQVEVNKETGMVKVCFTTKAISREYNKIAFVEQTASAKDKEAAAFNGKIEAAEEGKTTSSFEIEIPASKLGVDMPISFYQTFKGTTEWHDFEAQHTLKVDFTPALVTDLTSAIYYQERTEGTDMLCAAAGAGWAALTDEEKEEVTGFGYYLEEDEEKGGYEYFGEDTGDASKDNPRNADKASKYEVLVASFGTSYNDSRVATIGAIENAIDKATTINVNRAFTAQIIINHIQARDGEMIDNADQAMERAIKNGVQVLIVVPTTLMNGAEYDELKEAVMNYESKFKQIVFAEPVIGTNEEHLAAVSDALYEAAAKDAGYADVDAAVTSDTAFVFMGHGTSHSAAKMYTDAQNYYTEMGYKNAFVGTVEGNPESTELGNVIEAVQAKGYKKVILRPFMIVAGDHANNDMAGEEESWLSEFQDNGFEVSAQINGLGELKVVQDICVENFKAAKAKAAIALKTTFTIKSGKEKAIINIAKKSGMSGYQYRKATTKSGLAKAKAVTVSAGKKITFNNLKTGKYCYVQVRTYKTTPSGKKVYSAWSDHKRVTVK